MKVLFTLKMLSKNDESCTVRQKVFKFSSGIINNSLSKWLGKNMSLAKSMIFMTKNTNFNLNKANHLKQRV